MKTEFKIYSDIQSFVRHEISVSGELQTDMLCVNIEDDSKITISIENETSGNSAEFILKSDDFQKIVDWLKEKNQIV